MTSEAWIARAACRAPGVDPAPFFAAGNEIADAQRVCATCPVAAACLDYALETRQDHGVWGGHSERSRRRILRARRRAAAGAAHPTGALEVPDSGAVELPGSD